MKVFTGDLDIGLREHSDDPRPTHAYVCAKPTPFACTGCPDLVDRLALTDSPKCYSRHPGTDLLQFLVREAPNLLARIWELDRSTRVRFELHLAQHATRIVEIERCRLRSAYRYANEHDADRCSPNIPICPDFIATSGRLGRWRAELFNNLIACRSADYELLLQ